MSICVLRAAVARIAIASAVFACHAANASDAEAPAAALTLHQAISTALARNPDLQAFAFQLQAQDARSSLAALAPAWEVSAEAENFLGSGEMNGTDAAEFTLALSQVVELGGKRDARVASARAGLSRLSIERQSRQLDVLAEVTRRFIDVATWQERLQLAREGRQLAEQTRTDAKQRVTAAKSPPGELTRAEVALTAAQLSEQRAAMELENTRQQLAATWGEAGAAIDGIPFGAVQAQLFTLPDTAALPELIARLDKNPDALLFASEARLRDAEVRLASTLREPDLQFSAGLRYFAESDDEALVASVSMPLFSNRRASGAVAEAQAQRSQLDAEFDAAQLRAKTALIGLHRQLQLAVTEAAMLRDDMLPRLQQALQDTRRAYERGRYSYLELMDAQREYLSLQAALIDAASDAHTLQAEIERLTAAPLAGPNTLIESGDAL